MGRHLVPITIVAAMLNYAVAASTAAIAIYRPGWWSAAVSLAVLGGITPMIYAVNIRIVPVFARRRWPSERSLRWQVGLTIAGAGTVYLGRLNGGQSVVALGSGLTLSGAVLFTINVVRLFRQPLASGPAPPMPFPEQVSVDQLATRFTRLSGLYLLLGLGVGVGTSWEQPGTGRWDLVWAHAMLLGFFLSMASGVAYHVLSRWTGRSWRSLGAIRLHLLIVTIGLPLMLLALATDQTFLFAVAGPLQAIDIALFLGNLAPMVLGLPALTRSAIIAAMTLLMIGIALGASFAVMPELGARFRLVHAQLNLFGWTGLLISGIGYYLVPRFAGQPLRWPRLAAMQLIMLAGGALAGAAASVWRIVGDGPAMAPVAAQIVVALGFVLFGVIVAGTSWHRSGPVTSPLTIVATPVNRRSPPLRDLRT